MKIFLDTAHLPAIVRAEKQVFLMGSQPIQLT